MAEYMPENDQVKPRESTELPKIDEDSKSRLLSHAANDDGTRRETPPSERDTANERRVVKRSDSFYKRSAAALKAQWDAQRPVRSQSMRDRLKEQSRREHDEREAEKASGNKKKLSGPEMDALRQAEFAKKKKTKLSLFCGKVELCCFSTVVCCLWMIGQSIDESTHFEGAGQLMDEDREDPTKIHETAADMQELAQETVGANDEDDDENLDLI
mmetsp:Transcript_50394/g.114391  ORF Transcript_50394/g.114391 Transcript_50394/m.114391 type:complete len:214 (+) Transcript_50394:233-874(+)|eukprot:CAMPEP_0172620262 /NCGR_PEP_ID=MMETSP1068-20121228/101873_1 /TAXON_ID=35684 /ORGANISM="Pseudopedinella elastica, Strain CCMP716" /LENGTH=213 /DNA_ID=CAMNT_0013427441 /DNA_START=171 /DNA_END=812 /DNA_ORIENTATION=+